MTYKVDRRRFSIASLKAASVVAVGSTAPGNWIHPLACALSSSSLSNERILVVIQLTGGNDGLNTVVPFSDERYQKARPKIAIAQDSVLSISSEIGLHPSMRGVTSLIDEGRFSIVQGVGYPNPNRSHFESMDIWHTCQRKESRGNEGWLGRLMAMNQGDDRADSFGLHLGREQLPLALVARGVQTPTLATTEQLRWKGVVSKPQDKNNEAMVVRPAAGQVSENNLLDFVSASTSAALQASERLEKALASPDNAADFPQTQLGEKLKTVSRLILAGIKTRVYYVTLDGFDTHANQLAAQASLLRQWSDALRAFHQRLGKAGIGDQVIAFTFSEFGRRVAENASQGTDHGAAGPAFLSGTKLEQAIIGVAPDLSDLDDGDVKFGIDFRSVYAWLIEDWLGVAPNDVLLGEYMKPSGLKRT
jgi:uncharacterized protein (DUF1501 family)